MHVSNIIGFWMIELLEEPTAHLFTKAKKIPRSLSEGYNMVLS